MPQIGPLEILVIFVVALMVFGPKELPKLARQAAKAWREVQRFQANVRRDIDEVLHDEDEEALPSPTPTLPPKPQEQLPPGGGPPESEASPPADGRP
ncbi:MAG: twin-arginine translocase TatA/TatE family subunit [Actinobacteria bacterium]|nr:twin-arginine translocase TatA/TatE family subunit [Actinomycetota bacterium]